MLQANYMLAQGQEPVRVVWLLRFGAVVSVRTVLVRDMQAVGTRQHKDELQKN